MAAPLSAVGEPAASTAPVERLESLTGMRFLAALAVFSLHLALLDAGTPYARWMFHYVVQGGAGVSFFFILSGFVLTWSHPSGDRPGGFYRRRAARIVPNHVATWLLMGAVLAYYGALPGVGPALGSLLFLQPWIPDERWYWAMNTPAWSLGCEAFFYLLFPALRTRLASLGSSGRWMLMVVLVELILAVAFVSGPASPGSFGYWLMYFFPVVRLTEFGLGILVAQEVRAGRWPRLPLGLTGALALGAYVAAGWAPPGYQSVAVTVVPFALVIASTAQRDRSGQGSVLARPWPVRLGRWSFAFYLVHYPILTVVGRVELRQRLGPAAAALNGLAVLGLCVLAAYLLYRFVEQPLERLWRGGRPAP